MDARTKEQLGGFLLLTAGLGLAAFNWNHLIKDGSYWVRGAILGPAFACIGAALAIFPSPKSERAARGEDVSALKGAKVLTARWWKILVVSLVAGFVNLFLMSRYKF